MPSLHPLPFIFFSCWGVSVSLRRLHCNGTVMVGMVWVGDGYSNRTFIALSASVHDRLTLNDHFSTLPQFVDLPVANNFRRRLQHQEIAAKFGQEVGTESQVDPESTYRAKFVRRRLSAGRTQPQPPPPFLSSPPLPFPSLNGPRSVSSE